MLGDKGLSAVTRVPVNYPLAYGLAVAEADSRSAGDGRFELFKTTKEFDGPVHRKQHGFAVEKTG